MGITYKKHWRLRAKKELPNYLVLLEDDPFEEWASFINHEIEIEFYLENGIELLCGDMPTAEALGHFKRCQVMCDRAGAEKVYLKGKSTRFFPANYARILRARTYANWFDRGVLAGDILTESGHNLLKWCDSLSESDWDEFNQA